MEISAMTAAVEEVSLGYATRFGIERDADWFLLKLHEELGELTQAHLVRQGQARAKGRSADEIEAWFGAEIADVLAHVLLLARHHEVDVEAAVASKWLTYLPASPPPPP